MTACFKDFAIHLFNYGEKKSLVVKDKILRNSMLQNPLPIK